MRQKHDSGGYRRMVLHAIVCWQHAMKFEWRRWHQCASHGHSPHRSCTPQKAPNESNTKRDPRQKQKTELSYRPLEKCTVTRLCSALTPRLQLQTPKLLGVKNVWVSTRLPEAHPCQDAQLFNTYVWDVKKTHWGLPTSGRAI